MGGLYHLAILVISLATGQPVEKLDMTSKTGVSIFRTEEECHKFGDSESFRLAVEDLRKMLMARYEMPLKVELNCEEGAPAERPEGYA